MNFLIKYNTASFLFLKSKPSPGGFLLTLQALGEQSLGCIRCSCKPDSLFDAFVYPLYFILPGCKEVSFLSPLQEERMGLNKVLVTCQRSYSIVMVRAKFQTQESKEQLYKMLGSTQGAQVEALTPRSGHEFYSCNPHPC